MDRKSVAAGALVQSGVFLLLVSELSLEAAAASVVVGGVVAGWFSDSFEAEYVDGAAAAVAGLAVSLVALVARNWLVLPAMPVGYRIDYGFVTLLHGAALVILSTPVAGVAGSVTGHVAAQLRQAYGRPAA